MARYGMSANRDWGRAGASGNEYLHESQAMRTAAKAMLDSKRKLDHAAAELKASASGATGFRGLGRKPKAEDPVLRKSYENAQAHHEALRTTTIAKFLRSRLINP